MGHGGTKQVLDEMNGQNPRREGAGEGCSSCGDLVTHGKMDSLQVDATKGKLSVLVFDTEHLIIYGGGACWASSSFLRQLLHQSVLKARGKAAGSC